MLTVMAHDGALLRSAPSMRTGWSRWQVVFGTDYIVTEAEFETQPNRLVFVTGQPQAVTENTTQQEAPGGTGGTGVDRAAKTKVVAVVASLLLIIVYFAKRF
jgi:hypothetical protein